MPVLSVPVLRVSIRRFAGVRRASAYSFSPANATFTPSGVGVAPDQAAAHPNVLIDLVTAPAAGFPPGADTPQSLTIDLAPGLNDYPASNQPRCTTVSFPACAANTAVGTAIMWVRIGG